MHDEGLCGDSGKHSDVGCALSLLSATVIAIALSKPLLGKTATVPKSFAEDEVASPVKHVVDSMCVGGLSIVLGEPMWISTFVPATVAHATSVESWTTISVASRQLESGAARHTPAAIMNRAPRFPTPTNEV